MTATISEPSVQEAPNPTGYVIRIVHPSVPDIADNRVYNTLDEADISVLRVQEKLHFRRVREWEMHVVNLSTDAVEHTLIRRLSEVPCAD